MSTAPQPALPRGLLRFGAAGGARRLYCLPFAGGGPATYRLWPRSLPGVELIAVQLPGRDPSRPERPVDSMPELVAGVLASIRELQAADPLPFALFGHSMGALIAYEVAVALEAEGGPAPTALFVSGRRPPDEVRQGEDVHDLPDDEFLDAMQRSYGGVPDAVRNEPELLALFLPALRADIRALETYEPRAGRRVQCPVRVYGGSQDRNPRASQLGGWQRVVASDITVRVFDGDHFYLVGGREALLADLAAHG